MTCQSAELDALRAQVARLQAEKNDLVAMNSELQLKAEQDCHDDSFIEIIKVSVRKNESLSNQRFPRKFPLFSLKSCRNTKSLCTRVDFIKSAVIMYCMKVNFTLDR